MNKKLQYTASTGSGATQIIKTIFSYDAQSAAEEFAASLSDYGADGAVDGELVAAVDVVCCDTLEKTRWDVYTVLVTRWFAQRKVGTK